MTLHLPTVNALLNLTSAVFLLIGFIQLRRNNIPAHKRSMLIAFSSSTIFLCSYLYYHATQGSTRFMGTGVLRTVYFSILITHTILATAIVPFILAALYQAFKGRFDRHARITRWVWPAWMYVSITGVIIYWMLYRMA